jgi:hypothetical protein
MSTKKIPVFSFVSFDFDRIAQLSDNEIWRHLVAICRSSRKRIIPAKVHYDAFKITREPNCVTVHLLSSEKDSCRVSFVPGPRM